MTIERIKDQLAYIAYHDNGVKLGEIIMSEDGYYVFFPELREGFWEAYVLRQIADKVDEMNKPWDDQVKQFFADTANPVFDGPPKRPKMGVNVEADE